MLSIRRWKQFCFRDRVEMALLGSQAPKLLPFGAGGSSVSPIINDLGRRLSQTGETSLQFTSKSLHTVLAGALS